MFCNLHDSNRKLFVSRIESGVTPAQTPLAHGLRECAVEAKRRVAFSVIAS